MTSYGRTVRKVGTGARVCVWCMCVYVSVCVCVCVYVYVLGGRLVVVEKQNNSRKAKLRERKCLKGKITTKKFVYTSWRNDMNASSLQALVSTSNT